MSSNSIYNHRHLQPANAAPAPAQPQSVSTSRLGELLDIVKQEFDSISSNGVMIKEQRDEYEHKLAAQINEIHTLRQSFHDLKNLHTELVTRYEEEITRLRRELESRQGQSPITVQPNSAQATRAGTPTVVAPTNKPTTLPPPSLNQNAQPFSAINAPKSYPHSPLPSGTAPYAAQPTVPPQLQSATRPQSPYPIPPVQQSQQAQPQPPSSEQQQSSALQPITPNQSIDFGDPEAFPRDFKKEGSDWIAMYNPSIKRNIDVSLVHNLVHESVVCCVRFSADGRFLATGCNKTAQIYDTKTGAKTCVLADDNVPIKGDLYIRSVCFSPDAKYLATGAEDKQIRVWDIAKRKIKSLFTGHKQEIYSLDFSSDGKFIASGSGDKTARLWDVETNTCLHTFNIEDIIMCDTGPIDSGVTSVAISPDGRMVAAGSLDTKVRVWDVKTGQQLERLTGHKDSVYSVAFAPDGQSLVSGSLDRTLKIWDLSGTIKAINGGNPPQVQNEINGEKTGYAVCINTLVGHKDYVLSVAVSPDGQWIVSGSKDRGVQFWDPNTAQTQLMLQGHKNSVISIDLSPRGLFLATGSGDYHARIWSCTAEQS
ncbi:WD40 repeat-like protein [Wallemia mellicola]|nr:WD40 repeat-like protein [Wallemia mellicola]TIC55624.1 WD40 repeat-like protein [Wallemia mellicola]